MNYLGREADPSTKPEWGVHIDREYPLARGISAYWPLLENAGTITGDLAQGNTLAFNGTTAWAPGPDGPAVRFPGSASAYLQSAGSVFNPASGDFTAAVWFSIDAQTGTAQLLLAQPSGTGTGRNWLNVTGTGFITSFLGGASTTGTTTVTAGVWHLGVVTAKGTTVSVYLDANLEASATRTIDSNVAALRVGVSGTGTLPLAGYVGRGGVMLFTGALPPDAIQQLHRDTCALLAPLPTRRLYGSVGGLAPGVIMYHRRRRRSA